MTSREPYRPQRIGNLRERLTIQEFTLVDDGFGNEIPTWSDLATVHARIEPLKGDERVIAGGIANPFSVLMHIRGRTDLTTEHRISYGGSLYNIQRITNYDERGRFLTIEAETGA